MLTRRSFVRALSAVLPASLMARFAGATPTPFRTFESIQAEIQKPAGVLGKTFFVAGELPYWPGGNVYLDGVDITCICKQFDAVQGWADCFPAEMKDGRVSCIDTTAWGEPIRAHRVFGHIRMEMNGDVDFFIGVDSRMDSLLEDAQTNLSFARGGETLERFRVHYLGVNGRLNKLLASFDKITDRSKRERAISRMSDIRAIIVARFEAKKAELLTSAPRDPADVLQNISAGIERLELSFSTLASD